MRKLSIGLRLTLWYFVIFAVAQGVFGVAMWVLVRHSMYEVAEETLRDRVEGVRRFLSAQQPGLTPSQLRDEADEAYLPAPEAEYLQVTDAAGNQIFRAGALANLTLPPIPQGQSGYQAKHPFYQQTIAGQNFLFVSAPVTAGGHTYFVQTGWPLHEQNETLNRVRWNLLWFAPLVLLLASATGYWASHRALAPVDRITAAARSIGAQNLSQRLTPLKTGDELQRLSDTLNSMLERLDQGFQRIQRFTADASHELRTPVALIRTEAELALRRSRSEDEYKETLSRIVAETGKTTSLIESLLALARAESGADHLRLRPCDLGDIVRQAGLQWRSGMESHQLEFLLKAQPGIIVQADPEALQRVLDSLLDNAQKYTPSPGTVGLSLTSEAGSAVIQVSDSGVGIAAHDIPHIFERFYRADKARSRASGGTGLGLAIAEWIVARHGGSIHAESQFGHGTCFSVVLPLSTAPVAGTSPKQSSAVAEPGTTQQEKL